MFANPVFITPGRFIYIFIYYYVVLINARYFVVNNKKLLSSIYIVIIIMLLSLKFVIEKTILGFLWFHVLRVLNVKKR